MRKILALALLCSLAGCATFDAPFHAEDYREPTGMDKPRVCAIVQEGVAWTMTVPVRTCIGWTPI